MKISELIAMLEDIQYLNGDMVVCAYPCSGDTHDEVTVDGLYVDGEEVRYLVVSP